MSEILIAPLEHERYEEAARVLASAFVTNPLHIAVFGGENLAANEQFFRTGLAAMQGPKLVALDAGRVVGLIRWVDSPACQPSSTQKLRMVPAMVERFGARAAMRIVGWLSVWSEHDPREPHVHLGPVGVAPEAQRRHIGHALMRRYCEVVDAAGRLGYLETDRPANVDFYRRFGFEVCATASIHGTPSYFMRRPAQVAAEER